MLPKEIANKLLKSNLKLSKLDDADIRIRETSDFAEAKNLASAIRRLFFLRSLKFLVLRLISEVHGLGEGEEHACGDGGADDARDVGAHGVHEQEVVRVFPLADYL